MASIFTGINSYRPLTMATAPDGVLYAANGAQRPLRWDGHTTSAEYAGVTYPSSVCAAAAKSTSGAIYGNYEVYVRYVDDEGTPSCLSTATSITITSGAACTGFNFSSIPVSAESRVTGRQLWRTTNGQNNTVYLDLEIANNTGATGASTRTDGELKQQTAMRLYTKGGWPNANRFGPPPSWMSVVVCHSDRMWYLVPDDYSEGAVSISGTTVTGTGVNFSDDMIGRKFYVAGKQAAVISAASTSSLTLSTSPATGFGTANQWYSIGSFDERNRVYFSEAGEPESFALDDDYEHVNVLQTQEDGDQLTAAMSDYGYLYLFKHRHIYRVSAGADPRMDASIVLVGERGCLNQRCWARAEGFSFVMDRSGVYIFDGSQIKSISGAVQDYWRGQINWAVSKWFHVAHSADEETVRFFVALNNDRWPEHALCFNYRLQQWHLEEYPFSIGCSNTCPVNGEHRLVAGAEEIPVLMNEGVLDGGSPWPNYRSVSLGAFNQTVRGTVTDAIRNAILDENANFTFSGWEHPPTEMGAPLHVIAADGSWQSRRISSINSTTKAIFVRSAFTTTPSVGDSYQIGGIEGRIKLGTFKYLDMENQNVRQCRITFEPQSEDCTLNVRRYVNHSSTAETMAAPWNSEAGVQWSQGSANALVDLTQPEGYAQIRFDDGQEATMPAQRMLEVEMQVVSGKERTKIYGLDVDGVE